jgi:hypothetical protein
MFIGLLCERKIIFFPCKESFSFVGEIIGIVLPAHTHHGISAQIGLLNGMAGKGPVIFRQIIQTFDLVFTFDFHLKHSFVRFIYILSLFAETIISFISFQGKGEMIK